jgi:hypothetical protein
VEGRAASRLRPHAGPDQVARALEHAAHDVRNAAVGAHVLGAGQPLLDQAEELRVRLAERGMAGHDQPAQADHQPEPEQRPERDDPSDAPVDAEQQRQRSEQQQRVADQVDDQTGEEVAERGDVAVGPLDQLAGRVGGVERRVEPQHMQHEVGAQPVGRGQADVRGDVQLAELGDLQRQRGGQKEQRDARQHPELRAGGRLVDEPAQDLRAGELKPDRQAEQQAEQEDAPPLRTDVGREQVTVADRADQRRGALGPGVRSVQRRHRLTVRELV